MIGYLLGKLVSANKTSSTRASILLEVNQVGYEIQVPGKWAAQLQANPPEGLVQVFAHLLVKEDLLALYGFASLGERNLFRQLLSVSGVGAQLAIALLDTFDLPDLIQAIVAGNTRLLAKTPGVGSKTAERLALELKSKLAEWSYASNVAAVGNLPAAAIAEEVEVTLGALGYSSAEVAEAMQNIGKDAMLAKSRDAEDWIRAAIAWLSR